MLVRLPRQRILVNGNLAINGALNVGIQPEKVVETFLQCVPYTGFPKVLNAVSVAKKVFAERGLR